jgi:hypothetical protein
MDHEHSLPSVQRFLAAAADPAQALALAAEAPDELLSDETLATLDGLIEAERSEQRRAFLTERRALLENLRNLGAQFKEVREQFAALPEAERQLLAFMNIPNSLGMAALVAGSDDASLDGLEATAAGTLAEANEDDAAGIQARLTDLHDFRAAGREAAQARLDAAKAAAARLADSLIAWIQTPDWVASERYLREHAADLLTDDGEAALDLLHLANPANDQIPTHRQLLAFAREQGIDAAYAQLRRELAQAQGMEEAAQALAQNTLLQAVVAFLQAGDDEQARQVLDGRAPCCSPPTPAACWSSSCRLAASRATPRRSSAAPAGWRCGMRRGAGRWAGRCASENRSRGRLNRRASASIVWSGSPCPVSATCSTPWSQQPTAPSATTPRCSTSTRWAICRWPGAARVRRNQTSPPSPLAAPSS